MPLKTIKPGQPAKYRQTLTGFSWKQVETESTEITDVTQRRHQPEKQAEAAAIHEKLVAKQINTTDFSTDNGFSWFALLTTQF